MPDKTTASTTGSTSLTALRLPSDLATELVVAGVETLLAAAVDTTEAILDTFDDELGVVATVMFEALVGAGVAEADPRFDATGVDAVADAFTSVEAGTTDDALTTEGPGTTAVGVVSMAGAEAGAVVTIVTGGAVVTIVMGDAVVQYSGMYV